ncbi:sulfotransferase domain-containing protein [Thalassomonas viridans]|uniref:Sulfotransferase domain-containing protein n=1 Tax=Thalassomonas viridans TaxID=137584 RepID=A0AAE9Z6G0_9GAMM|nr:sulfotransferase domain-containing protein [Thalassomonas viridans]WDE05957.1 sulfotransferase domain-containing protein [Thalassomonas viridans]
MKNYACFILSTGRCGTQWLTRYLIELLAQHSNTNTEVRHEPLGNQYAPIANAPSAALTTNKDIIEQHLDDIQQFLARGKNYIETGFPCWRHISWFADRLKVPVKVIHLTRHPVYTSVSWLKLNAFVPPFLPHLPEKELFTPFAPGAKLPCYQQNWQQLSPFEKCLYYWGEVHMQALAYQQDGPLNHWLNISYETLFTKQSLNRLTQFLGLTATAGQISASKEYCTENKIDSYGGMIQADVNPEEIFRHPEIIKLANTLGYHELTIDKQTLRAEEQFPFSQ